MKKTHLSIIGFFILFTILLATTSFTPINKASASNIISATTDSFTYSTYASGSGTSAKNKPPEKVAFSLNKTNDGLVGIKATITMPDIKNVVSDSTTINGQTVKYGLAELYVNNSKQATVNFTVSASATSSIELSTSPTSGSYNRDFSVYVIVYYKYDTMFSTSYCKYTSASRILRTECSTSLSAGTDYTLTNVSNGYATKDVTLTLHKTYCVVIVNTTPKGEILDITTQHTFSDEGAYHILLFDKRTLSYVEYKFIIDKTAPTGTLSGVTNGGYTNSNVSFTWSDDNATATLNGNAYSKNATISAEGSYTIVLTDKAGLKNTYTFTIDKTAPTGTLSGVENGGYTKNNVSFSWSESYLIATLNGNAYTKNDTISAEGSYSIELSDRAGNKKVYSFIIDKTAPTGTLSGVENGGYTNSNVTFNWNDDNATATLNGEAYSKNATISAEGSYTIMLIDKAGNSTTYTFTIDKTAPTGTLYNASTNKSIENGAILNKNVYFTWSESYLTATLNGEPYSKNTNIYAEGSHSIVLTDRASNTTTYTFTIDKTAPTGTLSGVTDGGYTNTNVTFTWSESYLTATLNGNSYTKNATISAEGSHSIILSDQAGNTTTYTFTIDKTAPIGTLYNDYTSESIETGAILNKNVRFSWSESYLTATLNGNSYSKNATISAEGNHSIVLTDRAGNSSLPYTFTIDKTAPTGTLSGVTENGVTNSDVLFSWSERSCTITVNGKTTSFLENNSTFSITLKGEFNTSLSYSVILTDIAGNSTIYNFTINKTLPVGKLYTSTNTPLENGSTTNKNIKLQFSSSITATLNGEAYLSETIVSINENEIKTFIFELIDKLGNKNSYTVTINKKMPSLQFSNGMEKILPNSSNVIYYNKSINIDSNSYSVYIDNNLSHQNTLVLDNDSSISYTVKAVDTLGNSTTYTVELNNIPFTKNYEYFMQNGKSHISKWYESYIYSYSNNQYIKSTSYSFANIDDCLSFAYNREMDIAEYHEAYLGGNIFCTWANNYVDSVDVSSLTDYQGQPYYIYKDKSNASRLVAYFNTASLNDVINYYSTLSVSTKRIPSKPATAYPGDTFVANQNIVNDYIYIRASLSLPYKNNHLLYLNGVQVPYSTELQEGINTIKEVDIYGNIYEYVVMLDITKAQTIAYDFTGKNIEPLTLDFNGKDVVYYNQQFRLTLFDALDNNPMLEIRTSDSTSTTYIFAKDTVNYYDFIASGEYTVSWRDIAGNSKTVTLYLSLSAPSIELIENKNALGSLDSFNVLIKKNLPYNQILSIVISMYDDGTLAFIPLDKDYSDTSITNTIFEYKFVANGTYRIVVVDRFGTDISLEYTFFRNAPTGTLLSATSNIVIANNSRVNTIVKFTWNDIYATAYLNGAEYIKNSVIASEGNYCIELKDVSDNVATYYFTIDKTAPKYILSGVTEGRATNSDVSIEWLSFADETKTTAFIKTSSAKLYSAYSSGTLITAEGNYTFMIVDEAGNSREFSFTIDKTAPVIVVTTSGGKILSNNSITNSNIRVSWNGSGTAIVNGSVYSKDTLISNEGTYNITVTDSVGNANSSRIRIDKTLNEGILSGVTNGGYTNTDVTFSWSDADASATLNGEPYTSGTIISISENQTIDYIIVLSDIAGNSHTYSFVISKNAPTGSLYNAFSGDSFENGVITNTNVRFSWNEPYLIVTLNGNAYTKNDTVFTEGNYTIILTDRAGNSTTYTFTIDKTAPTGTLSGVADGGHTNTDVTFSWSEETATATLNGEPFENGSCISLSSNDYQSFSIELTDTAGNKKVYSFTIDKIVPVGTLTGVENNGFTNKTVSFTWTESYLVATLNGEPYTKNTNIYAEGSHSIVLTDRAGNTTTYTFTIDKSLPIFQVLDIDNNVIDSSLFLTNDIKISFFDNLTATLNGESYMSNTLISEESQYVFVLKNKAGNSTTYTFTIDKTAPIGTFIYNSLYELPNNGTTNMTIYFTWSESYLTATLNGEPYSKNTNIYEEGSHSIILSDQAGNTTTYTFTIDKTAPTGTLSGVTNGGYTNSNISFTWSDDNDIALLNGVAYTKNTQITAEGSYSIVLTDMAGNNTTYTFTIDKTAPTGTLSGVENGGYTKSNVSFTWSESYLTATLNGEPYSKNTNIYAEGSHSIVLTDRAGNSTLYEFYIYKTSLFYYINGVNSLNYTNDSFSINFNEFHSVTLNGQPYLSGTIMTEEGTYMVRISNLVGLSEEFSIIIDKTPPSYELLDSEGNILHKLTINTSFMINSNDDILSIIVNNNDTKLKTLFSRNGRYHFVLSDKAGNTVSFTIELLNEPPAVYFSTELIDSKTSADIFIIYDESINATATLNGEPYTSGTFIYGLEGAETFYTFIISDIYGNSATHEFSITKISPIAHFYTKNNEFVSNGSTINQTVRLDFNTFSTATLNDEPYLSGTYVKVPINDFTTYVFVVTDKYGNSIEYTISINTVLPVIEEIYESEFLTNSDVTFTWLNETTTAILNEQSYSSGTIISEEGSYIFVITTVFGNSTTYTFTIDKTAPVITIDGLNDKNYVVNTTFITWTENNCIATLNGEEYSKNTNIFTDGNYIIMLTDRAGNTSKIEFILDKSTPKITISINDETKEIENNKTYYGSITVSSEDTIIVNGVEVVSGTAFSEAGDYKIEIINSAGKTVTYKVKVKEPVNDNSAIINKTIVNIVLILLSVIMIGVFSVLISKTIKNNKKSIL